ncbi:MAG: nucleotidyltransferase family protein, partial [Bacillota bacterium]|nr:nucleotidyltransferase family protein [Bacillota bacterium]
MLDKRLREIIRQDCRLMTILQAAQEVNLPEWYIGAGVIRNTVWDYLHGYPGKSPLRDIDLAYFDSSDLSDRMGKEAESVLAKLVPD